MFSMIKINYLMLLLFMTIRDNSVHTKVKNIKSTTFVNVKFLIVVNVMKEEKHWTVLENI